jgi:hypothetical protein
VDKATLTTKTATRTVAEGCVVKLLMMFSWLIRVWRRVRKAFSAFLPVQTPNQGQTRHLLQKKGIRTNLSINSVMLALALTSTFVTHTNPHSV